MRKKAYQNYIFDLYGTLIDIHTDETKAEFWKKMADIYACYGAVYTPSGLRETYLRFCAEEEAKLREESGNPDPEITLDAVFLRLLAEADPRPEELPMDLPFWTSSIASTFRVLSRERFELYPTVKTTLNSLRKKGKRLFLLTNAQEIFTRTELAVLGLEDYFEDIRISSVEGIKKPQPEFLESLLRDYDLDRSRTVMVGNDISSDIKIADSCGIDSIFINTDGFNKGSVSGQMMVFGIENRDRIRFCYTGELADLLTKG